MRIRIKFRKFGVMRFVGHLDIMRYFQKAMRRAGIDIAYSEGYSPHQIMSFAAPLGVGITSDGEYLDIEANSTASSHDSIQALNAVMAEGMEIVSYVKLHQDAKKAMTAVSAADYIVYFKKKEDFSQEEIAEMIQSYYTDRNTIEITKQTKKSERVIDVKPLIYAFRPYSDAESDVKDSCRINEDAAGNLPQNEAVTELPQRRGFFLRLCTGSTDNIKPELVLKDMYRFFDAEYDPFNMQIHRLEIYTGSESESLTPLYKAGDEIPAAVSAGEV